MQKTHRRLAAMFVLGAFLLLLFGYCFLVRKRRELQRYGANALRANQRTCTNLLVAWRGLAAQEEDEASLFPEGSPEWRQHWEDAAYYIASAKEISGHISRNAEMIGQYERELRKPFLVW